MPIKIPENLPAFTTLMDENIFVMPSSLAEKQDIRPLRIIILNLMPKKIETEEQFLRLLSNTPLQVDIELMHVTSHISKNTPKHHLSNFYTTFEEVAGKKYDGLIITGAPVERLDFKDVNYWQELSEIMEWSKSNVFSTMHICWGAQAGLFYHFNIEKRMLEKKLFGIFEHRSVLKNAPLLKGFDEVYLAPHSRYTEVWRGDIENVPQLRILSVSDKAGIHIVENINMRQYFIFGHAEYNADTLANEYFRDLEKGEEIDIPYNYFPDDDIKKPPCFKWSCHANLMFSNWLNYCVYQHTPYDLDSLESIL